MQKMLIEHVTKRTHAIAHAKHDGDSGVVSAGNATGSALRLWRPLSGRHAAGLALGPIQGTRYPQLETGTNICAVSVGFVQPLPVENDAPETLVTDVAGSVMSDPVCVYCGSVARLSSFISVVGGHASALSELCGIWPAPAPPVCHAWRGGLKGSVFSQTPLERRGSLGIQPCSRPSWYDQAGAVTRPVTEDSPIFHVQKNQFCIWDNTHQCMRHRKKSRRRCT